MEATGRLFFARVSMDDLARELDWTSADLLRTSVDTVLDVAIHSAHLGIDDEQLRAAIPAARDEEQEVGP